MSIRRVILAILVTVGSALSTAAQMVIIPQERVSEAAKPTLAGGAEIVFDNDGTFCFGTLSEDSAPWECTVTWHEAEGKRLTITRITSSCSCLGVEWDKRKSSATAEGSIRITFHPKGRIGRVQQRLLIYTTISSERPTAVVKVEGEVTPAGDHSTTHPHSVGPLRLRRRAVTFSPQGGVERIAVVNAGSTPLSVRHNEWMTSDGISATLQPTTLAPGEGGDLVIKYRPTKGTDDTPRLYLEGLNLPPRKCTIEIRIEE